jgi:hypothetical protein
MKPLVILLLLLLAILGVFLFLRPASPPAPESAAGPTTPATSAPATAGPAAPAPPATGPGVVRDLQQAADYATGYTPLKTKQRMEQKIQDISAERNAALEAEANR